MKYKDLQIGKLFAVRGKAYKIGRKLTYGHGLLRGCKFYVFTPEDKSLPDLCAMQWHDGHIDRLKPYLERKPNI